MTTDEKSRKFLEFAAAVLGSAPLTPESAYGEVAGWDSVMHLKLVMETEAEYSISIPIGAIAQLRTMADFIALLP